VTTRDQKDTTPARIHIATKVDTTLQVPRMLKQALRKK
jgi:hypothetical protein